ncbi:hypothetical protein CAY53_04455 [Desulfobulbus oralis]|uniref:Uncharacterized protein n=1 Tax=Desulfobulbus oralis TaxID=1986146 RepID=A0A2L1GMB7_9BACT|nr:hypothetical protein CAY53_04455 [Desulfobulbus oralis]
MKNVCIQPTTPGALASAFFRQGNAALHGQRQIPCRPGAARAGGSYGLCREYSKDRAGMPAGKEASI